VKTPKSTLVAIVAGALAVPAAAIAHPGHGHANGHAHGHANGHGKSHAVSYIFKGTYDGGGLVSVTHGNAHVRKAGLIGDVQFDLTSTKLTVADTNGDQAIDATDVVTGDQVVVQARLPRQVPGDQPYAARHLVDQTAPPVLGEADEAGDTGDTDSGP